MPIRGAPPSLIDVPPGCAFHPRCAFTGRAPGGCGTEVPGLRETAGGHLVCCHLDPRTRRDLWENHVKPTVEAV